MKDLGIIRKEIDAIDAQIYELFSKRLDLAGEVAAFKIAHQKPVFDPEREKQ
ncbi:MAG: chorismate mutase, partial [Lachnospiraceae bacterium]|nr:chorismate mutase [Lachnospiraceae bacterium]